MYMCIYVYMYICKSNSSNNHKTNDMGAVEARSATHVEEGVAHGAGEREPLFLAEPINTYIMLKYMFRHIDT